MSKDHVRAAIAAVDEDADFVVDLTREMVRIPTVNPKFVEDSEVNREPDHQIYLEGVTKEVGLETEQTDAIPNRLNLDRDRG